ncbi:unnamed protein product [Laminaria digitata]
MTRFASPSCLLVAAFTPLPAARMVIGFTTGSMRGGLRMSCDHRKSPEPGLPESRLKFVSGMIGGAAALALPAAVLADPPLEKFVKDEVCLQRNLNGSCKKFGIEGTDAQVDRVSNKTVAEEPESELMAKLKKRTADNKSKNDEEIATKTFVNGQSGEFGPFSRYVPVKHKDTGRYELVLISELEGMKQSGLVVNERGVDVFADAK